VNRKIVSFHQDELSDWVATLDCGHRQHTRHNPPLSERQWVLSEEGRRTHIGAELPCAACARREMPDGYLAYRRTAEFTEVTVPSALLARHTTKPGVWARINVIEGRLRYRLRAPFDEEEVLDPGASGTVVPGVEHEVAPLGPVRFFVEFHRAPDRETP
jgi:tellurite methyltransferase